MTTTILESLGVHEEFFWHMPGYVDIMSTDGHTIAANKLLTNLVGFKSLDDISGIAYAETRCDLSKAAALFIEQDDKVLKSKQISKTIEIHRYADNKLHICLCSKTYMCDKNKKPLGVMFNGLEVPPGPLFNMLHSLLKADHLPKRVENCDSRMYEYSSNVYTKNFTNREQECLFFLIRGKSFAEIAALLHISRRTVETHINNMKIKCNLSNKAELIEYSINQGLVYYIPESLLGLPLI